MPRKTVAHNPTHPIHVCSRSNNRDFFPVPKEDLWKIFEDYLFLGKILFEMKIHSFVLMDNHFHLLATFPKANTSSALGYILGEISREIGRQSKIRNHQFGGRHFKSTLCSFHYFLHAYKYVYRNPVQANLCKNAEEYPFSTLGGLIGNSKLTIPVEEDTILSNDLGNTLKWLNSEPPAQNWDDIKKGLRRGNFKLPRNQEGFCSDLETQLL